MHARTLPGRILVALSANIAALLLAARIVPGFAFGGSPYDPLLAASLLTLAHIFVRPVVKCVTTPLIILTFGLFTIVVNAALLFALDFLSERITITDMRALLMTTLLASAAHAVFSLMARITRS